MFTNILGFNIFNKSKTELIEYAFSFEKVHIISGNPEVLYAGLNNKNLLDNFNMHNSLIIPDGIGVVIAAKLVKAPVKEKIAGIETMEEIIKKCEKEKKSIYLLGAKKEILNECLIRLHTKYTNLNIVGYHDGFFDINNCDDILRNINNVKPYAIFVAMGCPRQEIFVSKYMKGLNCNIFMGVGGSFDVMAGTVKRAPKWMINIGLEWLYRVIKEPWRIKRLGVVPKFLLKVFNSKYVRSE